MTILEIILLGIIWMGYGLFAAYQTETSHMSASDEVALSVVIVLFSPLVFIGRCLYGAFKKYR